MFFPFPLSSPTSVLCSSGTFWMAACFSWLPLKNVSRHWINGSHLLWFQTNFKSIKNLSHLSCSVPTPAWPPEAQIYYLGKGSKVPKHLPICGLSFVLAVPSVAGHSAAVLWLHKAATAHGLTLAWQRHLGAPHVPASVVRNPLPKAAFSVVHWDGWDSDCTFQISVCNVLQTFLSHGSIGRIRM